jgi:hypothetical protein
MRYEIFNCAAEVHLPTWTARRLQQLDISETESCHDRRSRRMSEKDEVSSSRR